MQSFSFAPGEIHTIDFIPELDGAPATYDATTPITYAIPDGAPFVLTVDNTSGSKITIQATNPAAAGTYAVVATFKDVPGGSDLTTTFDVVVTLPLANELVGAEE